MIWLDPNPARWKLIFFPWWIDIPPDDNDLWLVGSKIRPTNEKTKTRFRDHLKISVAVLAVVSSLWLAGYKIHPTNKKAEARFRDHLKMSVAVLAVVSSLWLAAAPQKVPRIGSVAFTSL